MCLRKLKRKQIKPSKINKQSHPPPPLNTAVLCRVLRIKCLAEVLEFRGFQFIVRQPRPWNSLNFIRLLDPALPALLVTLISHVSVEDKF